MTRRESWLILTYFGLLLFALVDLWTFVQAAPPMWAFWHEVKVETLGVLSFSLYLMESAFLLSLLLSATLLLIRSRWAIILGIAQLPVRILCGFSVIPFFALARALEGAGSPQMWFLIAMTFDFVRIAATVLILRTHKKVGEPKQEEPTLKMAGGTSGIGESLR